MKYIADNLVIPCAHSPLAFSGGISPQNAGVRSAVAIVVNSEVGAQAGGGEGTPHIGAGKSDLLKGLNEEKVANGSGAAYKSPTKASSIGLVKTIHIICYPE